MEIDDLNEKIRRNLIVFSFLIIVSWYLDFSLENNNVFYRTVDLSSVDPIRLWILATIVLIYLFYRYWFNSETQKSHDGLKAEWHSTIYKYLYNFLNREIEKSLLKNKRSKYVTDFNPEDNEIYVNNNKRYGMPVKVISRAEVMQGNNYWTGYIGNSYEVKWNGNFTGLHGGNNNEYVIPNYLKIYLIIKTGFKILLYSKSVTEFLVPILLFVLSLFICLEKLSTVLITSEMIELIMRISCIMIP